jgi:hypothetical protein
MCVGQRSLVHYLSLEEEEEGSYMYEHVEWGCFIKDY